MANIWQQLIGEEQASARYRRKRRDRGYDLFATHPAPEDAHGRPQAPTRRSDRSRQAPMTPAASATSRRSATIRPTLLDDQVKLNDPGASEYLIETLALDGWNGLLRFYEGEVWRLRNRHGDDVRAAQSYAAAVVYPDAPADAWRWHGISLMKAGPDGRGEGRLRPLFDDEARRARRGLGAADDGLREADDEAFSKLAFLLRGLAARGLQLARRRRIRLSATIPGPGRTASMSATAA